MLIESDAPIQVLSTLICDVGEVDEGLGLSLHADLMYRASRCSRRSDIIKL